MEESYLKYAKEVITNIAQEIDMGMICFLNTDTMEFDSVFQDFKSVIDDSKYRQRWFDFKQSRMEQFTLE